MTIIGASIAGDENQSASSAVVSDFRGHQALIEDFIRAIEQGIDPDCSGREGLIEALYQAARKGGAVSVSPKYS